MSSKQPVECVKPQNPPLGRVWRRTALAAAAGLMVFGFVWVNSQWGGQRPAVITLDENHVDPAGKPEGATSARLTGIYRHDSSIAAASATEVVRIERIAYRAAVEAAKRESDPALGYYEHLGVATTITEGPDGWYVVFEQFGAPYSTRVFLTRDGEVVSSHVARLGA